eukprot:403355134
MESQQQVVEEQKQTSQQDNQSQQKVINFYKSDDKETGHMSNFSRHQLEYKGKQWATSEHAFQVQKFYDDEIQERIRACKTPMLAAKLGRDRTLPRVDNWDGVRNEIMFEILVAKFTQNENIKQKLLATGDAILVEHTANDDYWGDNGDGTGQNVLGKLLMRLREKLMQDQKL